MAAISVPQPGALNNRGEEIGACVDECSHSDCAEMRKRAATTCIECEKPIGYDRWYFVDGGDWERLFHRVCTS